MKSPVVSIGLPVYNGAATLRPALDSLLAQDYADFELIISDNASTDTTESICREYAAKDRRVSYHRAERNMGAVWNFNRVFALSRGQYFMWAAADDTREPSYVRLCLDRLAQDPEAVLCYSRTYVITPGQPVADVFEGIDLTVPNPADRLVALMRSDWWRWGLAFYGLIRAQSLRATRLCENVFGHDYDVVLQLCLQGHFTRCAETTFYYTRNETGESAQAYYYRVMKALDPKNRPGFRILPFWKMAMRFLRLAALAPLPRSARLRLCAVVLRHGFLTRRRALEVRQLVGTVTGLRRVRDQLRRAFAIPPDPIMKASRD